MDDGVPQEPWLAAPNYTYTVESACGEKSFIGTFEITVANGAMVDAVALDPSAQSLLDHTGLDHIPTLDDLVGEYRGAVDGDADVTEFEHSPGDGHPTRIDIDWDKNAIDDESCYTITGYDVAG